jgi:D-alanyl-D-alanine-carboxypeptidase/D-alanyl-D-alanine-endopeptidase
MMKYAIFGQYVKQHASLCLIMRICRSLFLFALVMLSPAAAGAQHFPSDEDLITLIQSRVDEGRAVGIVLGVIEADGTTSIASYGDAGPYARTLGEKSVFEIGSITKVFTGTLLADMAARGEVSLADPVAKYLPEGITMPSRGDREITLLDLSTHHSALPRLPDNMSPSDVANPYADYTVEQMYKFLSGYKLSRDIGSEYEYSNLAVGLLGHVLARANGSSYDTLVRERILKPLGMTRTGIVLDEDMQNWMANGHDPEGNVVPLWDLPTLAGAGALRSDVTDMLVFLEANTGPAETPLERSMRVSHDVH